MNMMDTALQPGGCHLLLLVLSIMSAVSPPCESVKNYTVFQKKLYNLCAPALSCNTSGKSD